MLLLACRMFVNCKYVAKCVFQRSNERNMFINMYLSWSLSDLSRRNAIFDTSDRLCEPSLAGAPRPRVFARDIKSTHIITSKRAGKKSEPPPFLLETEAPISRTRSGERPRLKRLLSAKVCSFSGVCKQRWLQDRALIMCEMCLVLKDVFLGG